MDPETLRAVADIARGRAELARHPRARPELKDARSDLQRQGAEHALDQLARDLDASAAEFERQPD